MTSGNVLTMYHQAEVAIGAPMESTHQEANVSTRPCLGTPVVRTCACGCGATFATTNPAKRYTHPTHRPPKMGSTQAGRGWHYQQLRKLVMAQPPNGRPCPRCHQPMTNEQWVTGRLQCGHVTDLALTDRSRKLTLADLRMEHGRCNGSAGASLGNRLRAGTLKVSVGIRTSRPW